MLRELSIGRRKTDFTPAVYIGKAVLNIIWEAIGVVAERTFTLLR
jgi:hypothetical protein